MATQTIYEMIGSKNLQSLVDSFYDLVFSNEILQPLFKGEKELIKSKQYQFLTQLLGGPSLYSNTYGHPRMRMRHLPHRIDERAKDEWLKCMKEAITTLPIENRLKEALYGVFPPIAQHMVNS